MDTCSRFKNRRVKINFRGETIIGEVVAVGRTRLKVKLENEEFRYPTICGINWICKVDKNNNEIESTKIFNV